MRLIGAELPSGSFSIERGFSVPEIESVLDEVWDVLYGVLARRPGRGLVEVECEKGHFLFDRDLLSDELEVTIFQGDTPPDPALVAPGLWLLGTPRPTEDPERRLPLHLDEVAELRRRAESCRARATALRGQKPEETPAESPRERRRVDDAVQRLMQVEAERVERELRFDDVLEECLELLTSPKDGARAKSAETALLALADAFEKLEREEGQAAAIVRWRRWTPAFAAAGLASLGLFGAGQMMQLSAWTAGGAIGCLSSLAPIFAVEFSLRRGRKRTAGRRKELQAATEDAIFKARAPELQQPIHSERLRDVAAEVARKDVLRALRERLEALRIRGDRRGSKERRARWLLDGLPKELRAELASHWEQEPLMALPGLLEQMDLRLTEEEKQRLLAARSQGETTGAATALEQEAELFERDALRLERMDSAVRFIQSLATARRALPQALRDFLASLARTNATGVREEFESVFASAPLRSSATPQKLQSSEPLGLEWPDLEAELARLEAGLEAAARRIGEDAPAGGQSWTAAMPTALERIDAWMAKSGLEPEIELAADAKAKKSEASAQTAAAHLESPVATLVDLRIAPLHRSELLSIARSEDAARAEPTPALQPALAWQEAPRTMSKLHRAELPPITARKPAKPEVLPQTLLAVAAAEGVSTRSVPVVAPKPAAARPAPPAETRAPRPEERPTRIHAERSLEQGAEAGGSSRAAPWSAGVSMIARMWSGENREPKPAEARDALTRGPSEERRSEDRLFMAEVHQPFGAEGLEIAGDVRDVLDEALSDYDFRGRRSTTVLEFAEYDAQKPALRESLEPKPAPARGPAIVHYQGGRAQAGSGPKLEALRELELPPREEPGASQRDQERVRAASDALDAWRRERLKALAREP